MQSISLKRPFLNGKAVPENHLNQEQVHDESSANISFSKTDKIASPYPYLLLYVNDTILCLKI